MILENLIQQKEMIVPHIHQNMEYINDLLLEIHEWDKAVCHELSTSDHIIEPLSELECKTQLITNPEKLIAYINKRNKELKKICFPTNL